MNENLHLPGNPRYQPKKLISYLGYDNLCRWIGKVEIANLEALIEIGIIPPEDAALFTDEVKEKVLAIRTTDVDATERQVTKHDIRAWVLEAKKVSPPELGKWWHIMLTSYDAIDTARCLMFMTIQREVLTPSTIELMRSLIKLIRKFSSQIQIGRTHGQHALPITVGFWLALVLARVHYNFVRMTSDAEMLSGKISGAVGAYNAQVGLGLLNKCDDYESLVLEKLGLQSEMISSQVVMPEPLAYYLHSCTVMSGALAQLGEDCRQLMRSEISEIREDFSSEQSGSSTMAHKRNPINFENTVGMFLRNKNEHGKVLDTLVTEHQRDLVASSLYRDFPIILVNLQVQLDTLSRLDAADVPFLERITVDVEACKRNFNQSRNLILGEPIYIALQMAGYTNDAHYVVNHMLTPKAIATGKMLAEIAEEYCLEDEEFSEAWGKIDSHIINLFYHPEQYTGVAKEKAEYVANYIERLLDQFESGN